VATDKESLLKRISAMRNALARKIAGNGSSYKLTPFDQSRDGLNRVAAEVLSILGEKEERILVYHGEAYKGHEVGNFLPYFGWHGAQIYAGIFPLPESSRQSVSFADNLTGFNVNLNEIFPLASKGLMFVVEAYYDVMEFAPRSEIVPGAVNMEFVADMYAKELQTLALAAQKNVPQPVV
jgi:hypothetical protein